MACDYTDPGASTLLVRLWSGIISQRASVDGPFGHVCKSNSLMQSDGVV